MNRYAVLRRKQEQEIHALPIGFAFGDKQFEELMRRWASTQRRISTKFTGSEIQEAFTSGQTHS